VGSVFGPIRFLLPVCRFCWFLYTFNIHLYMYMHIFRHVFLSNYWWQESDIWSQALYRYAILWEVFLDPSDYYFLFAGFYTHWTYMHIFRHIFLSNYWLTIALSFKCFAQRTRFALGNDKLTALTAVSIQNDTKWLRWTSHDDFHNKGTVLKHVQVRKNVISHIQTVCSLGPVFLMLIISSILSNTVWYNVTRSSRVNVSPDLPWSLTVLNPITENGLLMGSQATVRDCSIAVYYVRDILYNCSGYDRFGIKPRYPLLIRRIAGWYGVFAITI
jgi:hypothetical protein